MKKSHFLAAGLLVIAAATSTTAQPRTPKAQAKVVAGEFPFAVTAQGLYAVVTQGSDEAKPDQVHLLFPNASRKDTPARNLAALNGFFGSDAESLPDHYAVLSIPAVYLNQNSADTTVVNIPLGVDGDPVGGMPTEGTSLLSTQCDPGALTNSGALKEIPFMPKAGSTSPGDPKERATIDTTLLSAASDPRLSARYSFHCGESVTYERVKTPGGVEIKAEEAILIDGRTAVAVTTRPEMYSRPVLTRAVKADWVDLVIGKRSLRLFPYGTGGVRVTVRDVPAAEILGVAHAHEDEYRNSFAHARWIYLLTNLAGAKMPFFILKAFPEHAGGDPYCNSHRRLLAQ